MSDDMVGKTGTGLGKPSLTCEPTDHVGGQRRFFYKETKWRIVGRVADEAVIPTKLWKHNRGKGLC